ncbi:MAG: hypothetical protein ABI605_22005 [Rhizobacter sp.]
MLGILAMPGNQNGISIDLERGMILAGVGFCVAYAATQNQNGLAGLNFSMAHANGAAGSGILGAWQDPATMIWYYDSVKKYMSREAAVEAAKKESQIAIYNLQSRATENIMTPVAPGAIGAVPGSPGSFLPSLATGRKRALSV